jgi:lipoprotein-anchoring transpeptidase ErfK/SrfK
VVALLLMLLGVGVFSAWMMQQAMLAPYETCIYPNVCVLEENLGGMTPDEASERLTQVFSTRNAGDLILSDGDQVWQVPWSEAGMRLDADATAQQALAAGRGQGWRTLLSMWLGERRDISPVFTIDAEATRRALEQLAAEMHEPPTDATLRLEGAQVVTTPSQPGRQLDVEATAEKIVNTVTHLGPDYPFAPTYRVIPPRITDVSSVKAEAEEMLNHEIHVMAHGEHQGQPFRWEWTLGRETIFSWLRVEEVEENPGFAVQIDGQAVHATVARLAAEPEADDWGFPTEEATQQVLDAFKAGGGEIVVTLKPPPIIYVVQSGDRLTTIAAKFGMPPGLIAEVNRGVDLDRLYVGQELIIPPQDVLRPYDPVPGKEIAISIPEQRLRVYEQGQLVYDWPCSTGMKDSPTYTGEFQVLSKEEMAYASQWDLQMPHFIGVYRAGGDTYNGIHALPILSNGHRLWAGNLGSPASFGCIILGIEEAETLFNWVELGVPVTIQ